MASEDENLRVSLTAEELNLLKKCKKETYVFRVLPLGIITSSIYLYSARFGRLASASRRTRILVGTSIIPLCIFYGIVDAQRLFLKRLPTLEHSPLLEKFNKLKGTNARYPKSNDLPGASAQEKESNSLFPKESSSSDGFSTNDFFARDDFSKQNRSYSIFEDSTRDSSSSLSDYKKDSFSSKSLDRSQLDTPETRSDKLPKFTSYKDRREYFRNNPKAESRFDLIGQSNDKGKNNTDNGNQGSSS